MADVDDVAAYILQQRGSMTTWKLQKLVYYAQAWHLVWDSEPLFDAHIEAWANGPVVKALYARHRGDFSIADWQWGDPDHLTSSERATIDGVLRAYGDLSGRQLSHLAHSEAPWRDARGPLGSTDRSNALISTAAMLEFYEALDADPDVSPVDEIDWSAFETS
jgi:uncharacterized phage-associated protein